MKRIVFFLSALILMSTIDDAMAACGSFSTRVPTNQILDLLKNKLVCAVSSTNNNKRWSEEHMFTSGTRGDLYEHARGSLNRVDPRRLTGVWELGTDSNGTVIYKYFTPGTTNVALTYEWSLWQDTLGSAGVAFCSTDGTTVIATAKLSSLPAADSANPCGFPGP